MASNIGIKISDYFVLDYSEIKEHYDKLRADQLTNLLAEKAQVLTSNRIFAHPCPHDEYAYDHLSFAGIYDSYQPYRTKSKIENITDGLTRVLEGRYNKYAGYYYARHKINSQRPVSILYNTLIDQGYIFGTAYIYEDKCLVEYFDSPVSVYLRDPKKISRNKLETDHLTTHENTLISKFFKIQGAFSIPLDIEFIVTCNQEIYINELRPISQAHLQNWAKLAETTWQKVLAKEVPSNVLNSIGVIEGQIVDLRDKSLHESYFKNIKDKIYLINHDKTLVGTSTLDFLKYIADNDLHDLALVIDHGQSRKDNHLQYIVYEDPGISFVVNTVHQNIAALSGDVQIESDGFFFEIRNG